MPPRVRRTARSVRINRLTLTGHTCISTICQPTRMPLQQRCLFLDFTRCNGELTMAFPRFKPDYIWTDADWASLPIKSSDLVAKLRAAGSKVLGVTNGRPTLQEKINDKELQLLVTKLLRSDA